MISQPSPPHSTAVPARHSDGKPQQRPSTISYGSLSPLNSTAPTPPSTEAGSRTTRVLPPCRRRLSGRRRHVRAGRASRGGRSRRRAIQRHTAGVAGRSSAARGVPGSVCGGGSATCAARRHQPERQPPPAPHPKQQTPLQQQELRRAISRTRPQKNVREGAVIGHICRSQPGRSIS
jgi:hypothetical protein